MDDFGGREATVEEPVDAESQEGQEQIGCPDCGAQFTLDEAREAAIQDEQPAESPMPSMDETRGNLAARNRLMPSNRQVDEGQTADLAQRARQRMRDRRRDGGGY